MGRREEFSAGADYRGLHAAPGPDEPGIHELDAHKGEEIYTHPQYYMYSGEPHDRVSMQVAHGLRGKPDALVEIHRAAPPGTTHINPGDWVTPALSYAQQHGRHPDDPAQDAHIITARVRAADVRWDGNDINEYGYHGPPLTGRVRKPPKKGW